MSRKFILAIAAVAALGMSTLAATDASARFANLLEYVEPDRVHVLQGGRIVQSGDKSLALELERRGYAAVDDAA